MKSFTLLAALAVFSFSSIAQDSDAITRDFGLTISRFSFENIPLNLVYKKGQGNKYWRFEASTLQASLGFPETKIDSLDYSDTDQRANLSLRMAREKRKPITDKFTFYHGLEFGISASYYNRALLSGVSSTGIQSHTRRIRTERYTIGPRLGYSIGGLFSLGQNMYLSLELSPTLYYTLSYERDKEIRIQSEEVLTDRSVLDHNTGFSISQGAVQVGVFYTFTN